MSKSSKRLSRPQQIVLMDWLRSIDAELLQGMTVADVAAMERPEAIADASVSSIRGTMNDLQLTYKRRATSKHLAANHHARQAVIAQSLLVIANVLSNAVNAGVLDHELFEKLRLIAHSKRIADEDATNGAA